MPLPDASPWEQAPPPPPHLFGEVDTSSLATRATGDLQEELAARRAYVAKVRPHGKKLEAVQSELRTLETELLRRRDATPLQ